MVGLSQFQQTCPYLYWSRQRDVPFQLFWRKSGIQQAGGAKVVHMGTTSLWILIRNLIFPCDRRYGQTSSRDECFVLPLSVEALTIVFHFLYSNRYILVLPNNSPGTIFQSWALLHDDKEGVWIDNRGICCMTLSVFSVFPTMSQRFTRDYSWLHQQT